jgi:N,N'-diacetyllegionaminate synthase
MKKVVIIAEAGVNHNGDLSMAKQLIEVAADAGADFVKFQTFKAEKLVSKTAVKADYQKKNINDADDSQLAMLKNLELSESQHYDLKDFAELKNIKFLSTAFDLDSIDLLNKLGIEVFKIPSGEITNYPYLVKISGQKKPVILSTGMSTFEEVMEAVNVLTSNGMDKEMITVLHCNTEYPTPFQDVNLRAMTYMGDQLGVKIGYSDHTIGIEVPIAAVALGACVIEKHFTLDRTLPGPDHAASLEPFELKSMVKSIRHIELALQGSGLKEPSSSEIKNKTAARKSVFANKMLPVGKYIEQDDLIMMRPGDGISPMRMNEITGKRIVKKLESGEMLSWEHIQ